MFSFVSPQTSCEKCTPYPCKQWQVAPENEWKHCLARMEFLALMYCVLCPGGVGTGRIIPRFAVIVRRHVTQVHVPRGVVPERCAQRVKDLTKWVVRLQEYPAAYGGFSDVWSCQLDYMQQPPERVAVKAIRPIYANNKEYAVKRKAIDRELKVWAGLWHRNVMPLYGITDGFGPFPAFVCPWADNGTLSEYLENYKFQLNLKKRMTLLRDIAAALQYLHARQIVHGDLSSSNVLIYRNGTACLSDFGLSTLLEISEMAISYPGNVRWAAPEGILESQLPSPQADVYSFGSVMLEILSGKLPFHEIQRVAQIVLMVSRGDKPQREHLWNGKAIPDVLWEFVESCWASPSKRPSSKEIVHFIGCYLQGCEALALIFQG